MFSFLFGRGKKRITQQTDQALTTAPNTTITYDPNLIAKLKADHGELLSLYKEIEAQAQRGNFKAVHQSLTNFKIMFHSHILLENVKLYVYLKHALGAEVDSLEIVREMRREMGQIGKVVNQFIGKYSTWPWSTEMEDRFPPELAQIGAALVDRIETEEDTLYTLYYTPESYL